MSSEGRRFFAWFYSVFSIFSERVLGPRRRRLLSSAEGRVIEIGAGTGANFPHYPPHVTEVLATEPDPHMLKRARKKAMRASVPVRLERAAADRLPVENGWADTVVSTLVLCSVPDLAAGLTEARRVLRPGGLLLFIEHVRSEDPKLARMQDKRERLHMRIAGGCHPNRDTLAAILAAGFEPEEVERYDFPGLKIVRPHVSGVARNPG